MGLYDDLSFNNGQYIPQYAGLPLEQIKETADTLSTRHYSNIANASQLQILANQIKSQLLPGAKSHVDSHISSLEGALQEMAANGGENSTARINALATALQGDQGILNATQRASEYRQKQKDIADLRLKKEIPLYNQSEFDALENAPINSELYNSPFMSEVQPYDDPVPQMEAIWDKVNADSVEQALRAAPGTTLKELLPAAYKEGELDLNLFFETVTKAGISKGKIGEILDPAWSSYKLTPAYKQQKDVLKKSDAVLKKEFYNHGLIRIYDNLSRDYKPTPAWAGNDSGNGGQATIPAPTMAPADIVESQVPYNSDGTTYTQKNNAPAPVGLVVDAPVFKAPAGDLGKGTPHPQYVKDLAIAQEVFGPEGTAKQYTDIVKTRTSNTWVDLIATKAAKDVNFDLASRYRLYEYMDMSTGEVVTPFKADGSVNSDWETLTGGKPENFKIESVYDVKHHYTDKPAADVKFVKPIAVTSTDADGKQKVFFMSQLPGQVSTAEINENRIYRTVNTRPGMLHEIAPGIQARELFGNQLNGLAERYDLTPEQAQNMKTPIEAVINGQLMLFSSAKHLAETLDKQQIYLPLK